MITYRVKDWSEFQHYKDRSPPWIRLHKRLLDNFRFHSLPDASRALAPMLWLLASENSDLDSGIIKGSDEEIAFRLRRTVEEFRKAIKPLIDKGFIDADHIASNSLAELKHPATPETEKEKETEIETEKEKDKKSLATPLPDWMPLDMWDAYLDMRKNKRAVPTEKATKLIIDKLEKWRGKGHDPSEILEKSITSNWTDIFEPRGDQNGKHTGFAKQDYYAGTEGFDVT